MTDDEAAELTEQQAALAAAHARGAAEERAAVVAWLRQPDNDFGQAAPAIEAGEHRRDIKVEQAGPETRSWVQTLTAKWPAGDPGEGHSGFCQHHLNGECAPGCRREGGRVMASWAERKVVEVIDAEDWSPFAQGALLRAIRETIEEAARRVSAQLVSANPRVSAAAHGAIRAMLADEGAEAAPADPCRCGHALLSHDAVGASSVSSPSGYVGACVHCSCKAFTRRRRAKEAGGG